LGGKGAHGYDQAEGRKESATQHGISLSAVTEIAEGLPDGGRFDNRIVARAEKTTQVFCNSSQQLLLVV
jgi:hypothetical protein